MSGFLVRNQLMTDNPLGTVPPMQSGTGGPQFAQPTWGGSGIQSGTGGVDLAMPAGGNDMQQIMAAFHQHMQAAGFPAPGAPTMPGQPPGLAPTAGMQPAQQLQAAIDADQANYHGREGGGLV
jgi:hypothetical protein